jgi:glycosyltransferase involved in cell wall biosynthesis
MPTTMARKKFIPLALSYFHRQDYPAKELIIVEDNAGPIKLEIPEHDHVRYISRARRFSSIGAKRNYACAHAMGDIIVHLDDDDWYAPDWISRQVNTLMNEAADICGLSRVNFYKPGTRQYWQYLYSYNKLPWVAGATMAYRKSLWEQGPFPDKQVGEDNHFVWFAKGKVAAHDYTDGFVSILHDSNTSPKFTDDGQWQLKPVDEITQLLGIDMQGILNAAMMP